MNQIELDDFRLFETFDEAMTMHKKMFEILRKNRFCNFG